MKAKFRGPQLKVMTITNGALQENCYLMWDGISFKGAIIDPGCEHEKILQAINYVGCEITDIFCTHGHFDHITAVGPIQKALGEHIPMHIHKDDFPLLETLQAACAQYDIDFTCAPTNVQPLEEGQTIKVGEYEGTVIHTPGHTHGSSCFNFSDFLFTGDTLFAGSIGRTDLPEGLPKSILPSIEKKLFTLPLFTTALPGHGPITTLDEEYNNNPYVGKNKH